MSSPSIQAQKKSLRSACRTRRSALKPEQVATGGRSILQRVLGLEEYTRARLVHTYVSSKDNEVDTGELIKLSLEGGKRVVIPVVQRDSRALRHAEIRGLEQLRLSAWGLFRPLPDHADWIEDLEEIDLVVVPGIAFDARGGRLGFGGGFYDRFLPQVQAPKVGLTYDCLLLDEVLVEPHDVSVDIVVTESAVYRNGRPQD